MRISKKRNCLLQFIEIKKTGFDRNGEVLPKKSLFFLLTFQGSEHLGAIIKVFGRTRWAISIEPSMTSIYSWSIAKVLE
jgi:hypothetical protein